MAAGRVFITGATGRLGKAVFGRTTAIPLVRKKSGLKGEIVTDFSIAQLKEILKGADAILHIAGSSDTLDEKGMRKANVELTKTIVAAAPQGCRIVFAGSVSVYGKRLAEVPADDKTPLRPDSAYARSKYEAEKAVESHTNHVILRIAAMYGPQFGDYFRIFEAIEMGKMRIIGDGKNRVPFVHVDDAADAFANAISGGQGVYVVAGEPLSQKKIYDIASRMLGVKPPEKSVGRRMALALAWFGELRFRLGGKRPSLTREHVSVLAYDRAFDCSRAKKDLGFSPRPLEEGIGGMVVRYRERPETVRGQPISP